MKTERDPDSSPVPEAEEGIATADEKKEAYIAALLRERAGLVARGLDKRVTQLDAELNRVGYERVEQATAEADAEQATIKKHR